MREGEDADLSSHPHGQDLGSSGPELLNQSRDDLLRPAERDEQVTLDLLEPVFEVEHCLSEEPARVRSPISL